MNLLFLVMEIIGTIAFTVSGAMEGVKHEMDLFGVMMLGLITAVGGGVIRDLIIGRTPPATFVAPGYALLSLAVSLIFFVVVCFTKQFVSPRIKRTMERALSLADAAGLAAFTVLGIESAMRFEPGYGMPVLVFVGVITGIGGGIVRDTLSGSVPYVFRKHIYALASLAGCFVMLFAIKMVTQESAALLGFFTVFILRTLASHYQWNLPRISLTKDGAGEAGAPAIRRRMKAGCK